ncbi:septation protein SepH [Serinicoccus sediminis]|uniref:septation protein SepH n=1 Tax=Serinicoccus sediminis TaxID=2306021 RepID=UPI0010203ED0|nr:septation protein SepH [Serinicoccus sediminis]
MQQLQFVELDEGGRLVLTDDAGREYAVAVDDRLRAALRPRPRWAGGDRAAGRSVSPRDVQAMIRAGQPAEDVAASTGWELERVRRFEGPVVAEREHVVGLAQRAPVRASGRTDGSHTLDRRVRERLQSRGVDLTAVSWDAARGEAHEPWTVIVAFMAGGRERRAAWHYDVRSRWVEALDDEARWLSEDEQSLPGGLSGHPLLGGHHGEDEAAADLMATMRERRQRRAKGRRGGRQTAEDPSHVPGQQDMPDEVLPLEDLPYDPETMGDPPAAHPRGSAPEAAAPVGPDEDEVATGGPDSLGDGVVQDELLGGMQGESVEGEDEDQPPQAAQDESPEEGVGSAPPVAPGGRRARGRAARRAAGEPGAAEPEPEVAPEPMSPEEAQRAVGRSPGRKRRRLRLPSLSTDEPQESTESEVLFARTRHDPREVTFDEFFGMEDEDEDYPPQGIYTRGVSPATDDPADEAMPVDAVSEVEDAPSDDADADPSDSTDDADTDQHDSDAETVVDADADAADEAALVHSGTDDDPGSATPSDADPGEDAEDDQEVEEVEDGDPVDERADTPESTDAPDTPSAPTDEQPTKASGRKGRTSVPSWDDIMFGSRPPRR